MIRVCHITTMTSFGGVEKIVQDSLIYSKSDNVKHFLVCPSHKIEIVKTIMEDGIDCYLPRRIFRYDFSVIFKVSKWVRKKNIDLIHSYNSFANNFANLVSILSGVPLLCSEHGTVWNTRGLRKWLDRFAYKRAILVTANSSASKIMLQEKYGVRHEKIKKLLNPVPYVSIPDSKEKVREELGIHRDSILVGTIARLVPVKGIDIFLRSAAEVLKIRKEILFIIVGGGQEYNALIKLSKELDISKNIIFTGWRDDARRLLKSFDIYVNCSIRESFGNVFIEAGFEKIPTIAPNIDGIPEAVIHNKTGVLINPTEPVQNNIDLPEFSIVNNELKRPLAVSTVKVAEEILKLIYSPEKRKNFGEAGYERTFEFSIDEYLDNLLMLYNKSYSIHCEL